MPIATSGGSRIVRCTTCRVTSPASSATQCPPAIRKEALATDRHANAAQVYGWKRPASTSEQKFARTGTDAALDRPRRIHSARENRIYYEPRCIEGNYGLPGFLHGRRMQERAFAEGRGPDPATMDHIGVLVTPQLRPLPTRCSEAPIGARDHCMRAGWVKVR